jgi:hypothetical protein
LIVAAADDKNVPTIPLCEEAFYKNQLFASGLFSDDFGSSEGGAIAAGFCCPFLTGGATEKCDPNDPDASEAVGKAADICESINAKLAPFANICPA